MITPKTILEAKWMSVPQDEVKTRSHFDFDPKSNQFPDRCVYKFEEIPLMHFEIWLSQ